MSTRLPTTELLDDFNQGDSLNLEFQIVSPIAPYAPLDITNCTVKFGLTRQYLAVPLAPDTLVKTMDLTAPAEGKAFLQLLPSETAALAPGLYTYGVTLTDAVGNVSTILESRLTLRPPVIPPTS